MDALDKIQKLAAMRDAGHVSAEEFEDGKRRLLAGLVEEDRPAPRSVSAPLPNADAGHGSAYADSRSGGLRESVSVCLSKYFDFTGRASRSEYWWWFLFIILLSVPVTFVTVGYNMPWLYGLFVLSMTLPTLAVGARRLHDLGRTGWWQAAAPSLLGVAAAVGSERKFGSGPDTTGPLLNAAAFFIIIVVLIFCARHGDPSDNKYGPV